MRKFVIFFTASLLFTCSYSQSRMGTKGIDSLEKVINARFHYEPFFTINGQVLGKDSGDAIGTWKRTYYINTKTGEIDFAQYSQRLIGKLRYMNPFIIGMVSQ